jgi:uncharacterized protein YeaO (DUF488 family)
MPIRTRRWNEAGEEGEGLRLLITRYRPRGVSKAEETWDEFWPELGPSKELHAAVYGKGRMPIGWEVYRARYLGEMRGQKERIAELARRVAGGEAITLVCSSACVREARCHRSLLKVLIEEEMKKLS